MDTLISTGTIASIKEVWWDIRPHPTYGTVELRVCDGLPTLHEVGMVAAISQCLVETFDREIDKGYTLPTPKGWVVRENKWRAARHGMDAEIITEDGRVKPVRDAIADLVHELRPDRRAARLRGRARAGARGPRGRGVVRAAAGGRLGVRRATSPRSSTACWPSSPRTAPGRPRRWRARERCRHLARRCTATR